jgi:ribosomal protein L37E
MSGSSKNADPITIKPPRVVRIAPAPGSIGSDSMHAAREGRRADQDLQSFHAVHGRTQGCSACSFGAHSRSHSFECRERQKKHREQIAEETQHDEANQQIPQAGGGEAIEPSLPADGTASGTAVEAEPVAEDQEAVQTDLQDRRGISDHDMAGAHMEAAASSSGSGMQVTAGQAHEVGWPTRSRLVKRSVADDADRMADDHAEGTIDPVRRRLMVLASEFHEPETLAEVCKRVQKVCMKDCL